MLDYVALAHYCHKKGVPAEVTRWKALAELKTLYLSLLYSLRLSDKHDERKKVIEQSNSAAHQERRACFLQNRTQFLLVGLVDLDTVQKRILQVFHDFVTPLVFAPPQFAEHFDEYGCLKLYENDGQTHDFWCHEKIELADEQIHVAETPLDQANETLKILDRLDAAFASDQIILGFPNETLAPVFQHRLEQAQIKTRFFAGTPYRTTGVFRFLEILLRFLEENRFSNLAELLRHPDVEYQMKRQATCTDDDQKCPDILSELDHYQNAYLPEALDDHWQDQGSNAISHTNTLHESKRTRNLHELGKRIQHLLNVTLPQQQTAQEQKSVVFWLRKTEKILQSLFAKSDLLDVVDDTMTKIDAVPEALLPALKETEALRLLIRELSTKNIPPRQQTDEVELLGWLELVMDDAPFVIVTGMNEGSVPSHVTADLFLPDHLRQHFHLEDNRRRFARDAYSLQVILHSRQSCLLQKQSQPEQTGSVHLIAGRRTTEDEPLLPSRLFFLDDPIVVAQRMKLFFSEHTASPVELENTRAKPGEKFGFSVPETQLIGDMVTKMNVTDFKKYKDCPLRFYFENLLRLSPLRDDAEEWDARRFGNLVHDILSRFGQDERVKNSESSEEIFVYLEQQLLSYKEAHVGLHPKATIDIQLERVRARLERFSKIQADWRKQGYRIEKCESLFDGSEDARIALEVDRREMFLKGRLDRIDRNEVSGELVVIDYKVSDGVKNPEKDHRRGSKENKEWINFQLPLYEHILRQTGEAATIRLAYFTLSKNEKDSGLCFAAWSECERQDALEAARNIVRQIWASNFSSQECKSTVQSPCDFAAICLEGVVR